MNYFQHPVTPADVSSDFRKLISQIAPGVEPEYVEVVPMPNVLPSECFPLVDDLVRTAGGQAVIGWCLWEMPGLFVEGEFHCVWRSPDGTLKDVAPKRESTSRILFLRDCRRRYEGRQVNNFRRVTSADPNVQAYLSTFDAEFELMNRGERAVQHGQITLKDSEAIEYHEIQTERGKLYVQIAGLIPRIGPYHPCTCGSGKKVKWCHGSGFNAL